MSALWGVRHVLRTKRIGCAAGIIAALLWFSPGEARAQSPMSNGARHTGNIATTGQVDVWTFVATAGDNINVNAGEIAPTADLAPWIRLISPAGATIRESSGTIAAVIGNISAPSTGLYTILIASDANLAPSGTGEYAVTLVRAPGALTTSSGDEGGAMVNGATYTGNISRGDLDAWTFTAEAGDHLNVGVGKVGPSDGLAIWLRVISPSGVLIFSTADQVADQVHDVRAPETGTYTVIVASYFDVPGGTGGYVMTFVKAPGVLTVSPGDQGGLALLGARAENRGTITIGDVDAWTFFARTGDNATVIADEVDASVTFSPWLRIVSPTGELVAQDADGLSASVDFVAPASGLYTVLISSSLTGSEGVGGYILTIGGVPPRLSDLTIDFGSGLGLYTLFNPAAESPLTPVWRGLHSVSPSLVAAGRLDFDPQQDLVVVFPGRGTWIRFNDERWVQLHPLDASVAVAADFDFNGVDDLVLSLPGAGIWIRFDDGNWTQFHRTDASRIVAAQLDIDPRTDLVVVFPGLGVWAYLNSMTWIQLHRLDASEVVIGNLDTDPIDDVVLNLRGQGLWVRYNNTTTIRLHPFNGAGIAVGNIDGDIGNRHDLIVNFPGHGVYVLLNGTTWERLHPLAAPRLIATDLDANGIDDLVLNFSGYGLWAYMNGSWWTRLHPADVESITAGRLDGY